MVSNKIDPFFFLLAKYQKNYRSPTMKCPKMNLPVKLKNIQFSTNLSVVKKNNEKFSKMFLSHDSFRVSFCCFSSFFVSKRE